MQSTVSISVVVPVFNVEDYLDECMRSIVGQTYGDLEIILVDDGATDASGALCDRWALRDGRISVIHQENRGLSAARNAGIDRANGEYIVFVDPDDTLSPAYVETLHRAITRMQTPCVLCGFSSRDLHGHERVCRAAAIPEVVSARECLARALDPSRKGACVIPFAAWSRICRRSLFDDARIRFPEGEVYEDVSVMFPVVQASGKVGLLPDVLYFKRVRQGSITQSNTAGNIRDRGKACNRFVQAVKDEYPELGAAADRYLEKCRLSDWLNWIELCAHAPDEEEREEARKEARRLRASALEQRRSLVLPNDLRSWLILQLLRFAPGLAPSVRKAWRALRPPDQLRKNVILYGLTVFANHLLSFLIVFYAARVLAAEALGQVSFAASVVGYFALLARMGIPLYGMRLCAKTREDPVRLSQAVADLFALGALLTAASLALLVITTRAVPQLEGIGPLVAIFGVGALAQCINFEWVFKGLEEYRYLLARSVAVKVTALALVLALVHGQTDLYGYAAITAGSALACGLIDVVRLRRFVSRRHMRRPRLKQHARPVHTFFLMSCATLIYTNLDIVMLGFMRDAVEVGHYQIAAKAKAALAVVGGIVWNAALPRATALWAAGDRAGFQRIARRSLRFVCLLQVVVTVVFLSAAEPTILFIAGDGYLPATPAFMVLLLALVPIGVSNIIGGQVLIPAGKEKRLLVAELAGAALNLALNLAFIPRYGIMGAAAATVAAEVAVALMAYWFARQDLHVALFPWDRALGKLLHGVKSAVVSARFRAAGRFISDADARAKCRCPCCDTKLRRWRRARFSERPDLYDARRYEHMPQDVVCPVCGCLPRQRIIVWHLEQRLELVAGKRILHFAPERGLTLWFRRRKLDVTTADPINPADLQLDLMALDLPDVSYDVVVCNHVLEHVPDYRRALAEIRRILRPGGLLICSFPVDPTYDTVREDAAVVSPKERVEHFGQHDHWRVFGRDSMQLLFAAGFRVELARGADCPAAILPVTGPADYDSPDIFFCWKDCANVSDSASAIEQ